MEILLETARSIPPVMHNPTSTRTNTKLPSASAESYRQSINTLPESKDRVRAPNGGRHRSEAISGAENKVKEEDGFELKKSELSSASVAPAVAPAMTIKSDSQPSEELQITYKNLKYIGPTKANRPMYKARQAWEWDIYPHGVSRQNGKIRVQIKQKGVNPTYPSFLNTMEGLLAAAMFRDVETMRLWKAGILVRAPKFNFAHPALKSLRESKRSSTSRRKRRRSSNSERTTAASMKKRAVGPEIVRSKTPTDIQQAEVEIGSATKNHCRASPEDLVHGSDKHQPKNYSPPIPSVRSLAEGKRIQRSVFSLVREHPVVIFSATYCPFSTQAKNLFDDLKVKTKVIEVDIAKDSFEIGRGLLKLTGKISVPSIFVGGRCLGGCSEDPGVFTLHARGELVPLLEEAGAIQDLSPEMVTPQDSEEDHDTTAESVTPQDSEQDLDTAEEEGQEGLHTDADVEGISMLAALYRATAKAHAEERRHFADS
eukprot:CAMPEP_0197534752 /NCGR_PEP_ID=MMETSP1318-20131121/48211_1 /TAXON_ID=552666 /ORGANISM="Partenskyella glossopodia, Strain RCC365" /LENGTH=483 /DNA_ID=CAMNT_0043092133 /DNA_START=89 /DNA_END=1540 /DNA_ORIENTATION=-